MTHFVPLSAIPPMRSVIASIDMTDDAGGPFHVLPGEIVTIGKTTVADDSRDWGAIPIARFPVDVGDRIACMVQIRNNEVTIVEDLVVVSINGIADDGEVIIGLEDDDHDMTYFAASNLVVPSYIDFDDVIESETFFRWLNKHGVIYEQVVVKFLKPLFSEEDETPSMYSQQDNPDRRKKYGDDFFGSFFQTPDDDDGQID